MKYKIISVCVILIFIMTMITPAFATGNGAPSGAHYNLNIIGVNDKTADMSNSNGHVIFVSLSGKTKINLIEGADFQVLDKNGTDNDGASFQLPNPDPDNTGYTIYSVFVRALGKPGKSATITPAFIDEYGNAWYSASYVQVGREHGKSTFENVSKELLYVYVDMDGDGVNERYNLFNDVMEEVFWEYDNSGLKLLQMRFYPISTNVN